ncbi:purine-cytosine permease family protein [Glutamicibacter sp. Je.9.36]|uniref:purine-cytosine permease family protein n=1 Tax=Glutamicibacter sp. Je.9.36 TaxID=3142837 RepID=UPI003DA8391E
MSDLAKNRLFAIEKESIGPIPAHERHGSGKQLFAIWMGMNMTPLTVVTGATATTLLDLPFLPAALAILLGHAIGGIGMALHAAQGPVLGIPQMLQARGQFGTKGANLVVVIAILMFVGYFASNLVVSSASVRAIIPQSNPSAIIIACAALSFVIAAFGYNLIRKVTEISAYVVGALAVIAFAALLGTPEFWGNVLVGEFSWSGFCAMVAIGVVWQLAYAPYVSDYSRYMPRDSGARGAFWGTYLGCVVSSVLLMLLGAGVGVAYANLETMSAMSAIAGPFFGYLILFGFALAAAAGNSVNVYCSTLCLLTLVETFRTGWRPAAKHRIAGSALLHVIGAVLALAAATSFASSYFSFLSILLYLLIPWSAINLVDYYLVRAGSYAVNDFYLPSGGRYGSWNRWALAVFVLGVVVQIPFMSTAFYAGPAAEVLGGIDIAWLVGLLFSGIAYLAICRKVPSAVHAIAETATSTTPDWEK